MDLNETTVSSEIIYKGSFLTLKKESVILPNCKKTTRDVLEHPGAVCILPLTDSNEVITEHQYRTAAKDVILELPAGKIDPGEHPITCAKRELAEETGFSCYELISLGRMYPSPGYSEEIIWMYMARGLKKGNTDFDFDEFIEIEKIPFDKLYKMVVENEIDDAKTQLTVLKAHAYLEREKHFTDI